jgi:Flp pilus assembly protein TadB
MWVVVVLIETAIIAVSSYQSRGIRAEMRRTSRELALPALDSAEAPVLKSTNPRADSARDSALVLLGRLLADSGVQRTLASAVTAAGEAARDSLILAAVLLLPLPTAASFVTLWWLWLRRRRDQDLLSNQTAA